MKCYSESAEDARISKSAKHGHEKNIKRHAPTHMGHFHCTCGYNSLNRDYVTAHQRRWHCSTIHIVDRSTYPRFCEKVGMCTTAEYTASVVDTRLAKPPTKYSIVNEPPYITEVQHLLT